MYILDTDVLSTVFRKGQQTILGRRLAAVPNPLTSLFITVVTAQEMMWGRLVDLRDDKRINELPRLFKYFNDTFEALQDYPILPFDDEALAIYRNIPKRTRTKTNQADCRIAAIAVARNLTVITMNVADFTRIKQACNVRFEDWSVPYPGLSLGLI